MEHEICALCGGNKSATLMKFDAQEIIRCETCGLCRATAIPDCEEIQRRYGADYFEDEYKESVDPEKERAVGEKLFATLDQLGAKGRLLDVGCGTGEYLAAAGRRGWVCFGVDVSAYAVRVANKRPGVAARAGFLETVAYDSDFFDAAILIHSIEHQIDPLKTLRELRRIVRPGGVILIATPNINSSEFRRLGRDWSGLQVGHHFYFFNQQTLKRMTEAAGFQILNVEAPADIVSGEGVSRLMGERAGGALRRIGRRYLGWAVDMARRNASRISEGESVVLTARKPLE